MEFRVWSLGFGVSGLGFLVRDKGLQVKDVIPLGSGFRGQDLEFRILGVEAMRHWG